MILSDGSVYYLITELCEKYFNNPGKVRYLRSNCYELLLGKKLYKNPREYKDLEGAVDPSIHLLGWCYTLIHHYDRKEVADNLQRATEQLKNDYGADVETFNRILTFLLCLKSVPKKDSNKLDLSSLPEIDENVLNLNQLFKLPAPLLYESRSLEIFELDKRFTRSSNKFDQTADKLLVKDHVVLFDEEEIGSIMVVVPQTKKSHFCQSLVSYRLSGLKI
ncbi:hypothetical protein GWI33_010601 [Rhynchophorus ferrugineus]|uniref:Uncharacterized protein n=1 Tax=Rhynchophorus ferrugineus TaxID=354439 RepID=A0A834IX59_RHYFE|nr:hypothetical protein GWI33_010601 [Rhynchophorus ferrugineus]